MRKAASLSGAKQQDRGNGQKPMAETDVQEVSLDHE